MVAEANMPELEPELEPEPALPAVDEESPFPLADPGEYYIGLWANYPNYGCPYCMYTTIEGSGAVELHILTRLDQGSVTHLKVLDIKKGELA
jgi:hypothetical protein